jgi:EAL domain-containing protein (putative c-di-GMP-specific phosphodiesterase class I)
VSPGEFIPLAEHTGAIVPLTTQVLETAIAQLAAWQRAGHPLRTAVNISARILHDETIVGIVLGLLERYGVAPADLDLEVTESCIMDDARRAEHVLNALHREGLRISIDDFGTGYSSLSYLARLPVSEVKIDRSFVTNLEIDPHNSIIVRSTIELGRSLGLEVTAEGVESSAVRDLLRDLGCDYAQGYLIGRPAAPDAVAALAGRVAAEQSRRLQSIAPAPRRLGTPQQDAVG